MQIDSFTITIIVILLMTVIGAYTRKRKTDKCLRDFKNSPVTVERINGEIMAKGILNVESSGIELKYPETIKGNSGINEASFLLYKYEYPQIQSIIRYHNELSEKAKIERTKELKKTYKPSTLKQLRRKITNIFKTLKDSTSEIANVLFMKFKSTPTGSIFKTHGKYVKKINTDLIESMGTAYDALLENYIGQKIVFEIIKNEKLYKYSGILKDYTTNFIELMDVEYKTNDDEKAMKADIILPQKLAIVRHLSEAPGKSVYPFIKEIKQLSEKISEISLITRKNKKENPINK